MRGFLSIVVVLIAIFAGCTAEQREQDNPYKRELRLKATGNHASVFRIPEQPEELWRLPGSSFGELSDQKIIGTELHLLEDGAFCVRFGLEELGEVVGSGWHSYYVIVRDKQVETEMLIPVDSEEVSWWSDLIPTAPPQVLIYKVHSSLQRMEHITGAPEMMVCDQMNIYATEFDNTIVWEQIYTTETNHDQCINYFDDHFHRIHYFENGRKQSYSIDDMKANELANVDLPVSSTRWIDGPKYGWIHDLKYGRNGTAYLFSPTMLVAVSTAGVIKASFENGMEFRSNPMLGLDGKLYLIASEVPTQEQEKEAEDSGVTDAVYHLWARRDEYVLILNQHLRFERKKKLGNWRDRVICVDETGNYLAYVSTEPDCNGDYDSRYILYDSLDREQWRYVFENPDVWRRDIVRDPTGRFIFSENGVLVCLGSDGSVLWTHRSEQPISEFMLGDDGLVYCIAREHDTCTLDGVAIPMEYENVYMFALGDANR